MRGTTEASDLGVPGLVAKPVDALEAPPRPPKIGQDSERARAGRRGGRTRGGDPVVENDYSYQVLELP